LQEKSIQDSAAVNPQIWALYLDLEKNLGSFETIRAAFKRAIELKVITPFMIITYAKYLEEN
jgi:pre-mRNA-splicing factor SYF1